MALVFKLFANCLPVRGATRSTICDLQRGHFELIPNDMFDVLVNYKDQPVNKIKDQVDADDHKIIEEYFDFLVAKEFGFWCDQPECFPGLDLSWDSPAIITNAILDIDAHSDYDIPTVLKQLDELGCRAVQLRFYTTVDLRKLNKILFVTRQSRLEAIELMIRYSDSITKDDIEQICEDHPRISIFHVHTAPETKNIALEKSVAHVIFNSQQITSSDQCGHIYPGYFSCHIYTFTESQQYNTCLNRKVGVDVNGNIKNCPSLPTSFGNIKNTSLHSAIVQKNFKDLWGINKDQIEVCRDCEFRHICTDCRAFISDQNDLYSKPSKCSYDPYSAQWINV